MIENEACVTLFRMESLRRLYYDPFMRHNAVYFVGSFLVAGLNYLYHPILSRMLPVDEFGELTAIFSLTVQTGAVLGVFNMVAIHLATNESAGAKRSVLQDLYAVVFWAQIVVVVGMVIFSPMLASALQFTSIAPFLLLSLISYLALPFALSTSVLQGKKEFLRLSIGSFLQSGGKLVFAVLFVLLGWGVFGAIGALAVAQIIALMYFSWGRLSEISFLPKSRPTFDQALFSEMRYGVLVFLATSTVALLYTADTLLVKYFFLPDVAGEYSGISVIARILFFATASISAVLLPSIKLSDPKIVHYRILAKSGLLILAIGGTGLAIMSLVPEFIVGTLLGTKYLPFAHLLPSVALVMFFASIINLIFIYLLALRKNVLIPMILCATIGGAVLVSGGRDSVESIVRQFLYIDIVLLIALLGFLLHDFYNRKEKKALDHRPSF